MLDLPALKIAMIGLSDAGKSTYLLGAYASLSRGVGDFQLRLSDHRQALELLNEWDYFKNYACWPSGTSNTTEYKFDLLLQGDPIAQINCLDYRGGILTGCSDSKEDLDRILKCFENFNGVLVCLPADLLKIACLTPANDFDTHSSRMCAENIIRDYQIILERAVPSSIPVVLMITKGDIITTKEEYKTIIKYLKTKFHVLFQEYSPAVMIVRVRLGRFAPCQFQGGEIAGVVDPKNFHVPILFHIWQAMKEEYCKLEYKLCKIENGPSLSLFDICLDVYNRKYTLD